MGGAPFPVFFKTFELRDSDDWRSISCFTFVGDLVYYKGKTETNEGSQNFANTFDHGHESSCFT